MKTTSTQHNGKILIIDDDEQVRQSVQRLLGSHGFEVIAAGDGRMGILLATRESPDLVLCDLAMPEMDGYEVLAALRREPGLADIPFVFLTGQSEPEQVRQGMNLGADDYLAKGDTTELLKAIQARLARRQSDRARQASQIERAVQLFAGIVHDLRDPLSVVFGYTDLLKATVQGPEQGEIRAKAILDRMRQATLRMQGILAETMFLARSRMQRLPFDPSPFDLRHLLNQLVEDHEQNERLSFVCAGKHCPVVADALRIHQAVDQLVSNALKYSTAPVVVRLSALLGRYKVEVEDHGLGIPAEDQPSIFEPFFRASNAQSVAGNGLGLCIVKSCIEQHGGTASFSSQVNQGSTFVIELPTAPVVPGAGSEPPAAKPSANRANPPRTSQAPRPVLAIEAREKPAAPPTGTETPAKPPGAPKGLPVLRAVLIDDDALVRGVLRDLLEDSKQVTVIGEAETVNQGRRLLGPHGPEVVFLDVNLPDGCGFDLLPHLKPRTSVVVVSSSDEHAAHAFDIEAVDYLVKPVTPERLQKTLARLRRHLEEKARPPAPAAPGKADSFLVKTLTDQRLVKISEVNRVLAYGEYSWVYWENEQKGALLRKSLKQWLRELPGDRFVRVHRRAIVNLNYLDRIERLPGGRMQIHLRDTLEPIPVSLRLGPLLNRKLKAPSVPGPAA